VMSADPQLRQQGGCSGCRVDAANGVSAIFDLSPQRHRDADCVITPPNSSVMFAACAAIPMLHTTLPAGEHWLACAVQASASQDDFNSAMPELSIENHHLHITNAGGNTIITIAL